MSALLWLSMLVFADARVALQPGLPVAAWTDRSVSVEPLAVEGEIPAALRETLRAQLHEGLGRGSFEVVGSERAAAGVVRTHVVARGRDLDIAIELVDRSSARSIARVEAECDTCGATEAAETMSSLAMALSRRAAIERHSAVQIQAPPAPVPVLETSLPPPAPRLRRPVRWAVGWATLAIGALGTAGGVALIAIDDRPIKRKCNGGNVDRDGTCRWVHKTMVPGAVIGTLAVGLLTTGIALVIIESRRVRSPALRAMLERTPAWARARAIARR